MKKVCIATFYGSENYGSNLQAIGLSETLKAKGYEVQFLSSFKNLSFIICHPMLLLARAINKIKKKQYLAFFVPEPYELSEQREERLSTFRNEHFSVVDYKRNEQWKKAIRDNTIFIAGSDIIWNPARGYPSTFFLDFAYYAKLPRFSYGSSVGAKELPHKYYRAYRRYLNSMISVGVREQSVALEMEGILNRKVEKVVDPTLLLSRDEWDEFANRAELSVPIRDKYILCYFVMNDKRYWDYVQNIKDQTGKEIVILPMHKEDENKPYTIVLDGTPYEFLKLIRGADFVCTDSFHACIFSMIYEKDFYLLRRKRTAEDAKYIDLLSRYNLMNRIVENEKNFIEKEKTDYSQARSLMKEDREKSVCFITDALKIAEKGLSIK